MNEGTPIIIKKKKVAAHGHHGGSWKVAYADFVTAMMAFFMVMWILGMSESDRSVIASYFKDPVGFSKSEPKSKFSLNPMKGESLESEGGSGHGAMAPIKDDEAKLKQVQQKVRMAVATSKDLKQLLKSVEVAITKEGLRIELVETAKSVFFETGQATIRPSARKLLATVAPLIASSGRKVIIEGHTDARPYPGESYTNVDLSFDRAHAVWRALRADGVGLKQYGQMRAMADQQLKVKGDPYSPLNRRVTILLPFAKSTDTVLPKAQLSRELKRGLSPRGDLVDIAPPRHPEADLSGH